MKKGNIDFGTKVYSVIQIIIGVITYVTVTWLIFWQVEEKFKLMMGEGNVGRTLRNYQFNVLQCAIFAGILTIIWWILAWVKIGTVRSFYEQNTFIIAIGFCVVLFVAIFILSMRNGEIIDDQGQSYPLYYAYAIWSTFVFNMYGFPPDTVKNVIFFGQRIGRIIVSAIMILCTILILYKGEGL